MAKKRSADQQKERNEAGRERVKRVATPTATFVSLYTNDTQVQMTPWDVRITFGEIVEVPTAERREVVVRTTGEVRMSPQHAKRMAEVLVSQLAQYERNFGPIPMPKRRDRSNGSSASGQPSG